MTTEKSREPRRRLRAGFGGWWSPYYNVAPEMLNGQQWGAGGVSEGGGVVAGGDSGGGGDGGGGGGL